MAINYGLDRIFLDLRTCPECGGYHGELEFKRIDDPDHPGMTHRARCMKTKSWTYINLGPKTPVGP